MARQAEEAISYVLRDPNGTTSTPIIGIVRFNNDRIKVATGFKVIPAHWNPLKSRVKNVVDATDKQQINDWLQDTQEAVKHIIADMKSNRQALTKESVKVRIDAYLKPVVDVAKPEPTEPALFTFIADFITAAPTRVNIETGKHVERRTIQKYETVLKVLREFATTYRRRVDFDSIDLDFYDAFNAYLTATKGFATNNVGKYLQTLKVFLNDASARGIAVKQDYRSRKFKVVKEDADNVYLSEAELLCLQNVDLSRTERLERVRDLFLVGCYTGLRFSDLTNLRPEYIKDGLIRIEQQKTADKVVIPCHAIVTAMLTKYGGTLPRSISNQKMNDYLKEVCQLAGINSIESKAQTKGGKRITKSFEKWEMVSTHTARRSFATNMYLLGIPAMTIMQITGHRTEKAFMKYIKLDREQHAKVMALHWQKQVANSPFKIA
ncbi:phage integrase SAM-like domain-containing protein [Fibrella sp. HMF5335]|uniref:Phage integrase SAM-like domain-containing protein n=1 Tax=Fibrella rubiginis TaxID=2817060 RepID=A0A939K3Y6_9BACT|nr:site-specific integrase [Fibrella rubiginis]MBO0937869.1 phage integrase SAM-like domain-containing protein [Fibrella rubiginis]